MFRRLFVVFCIATGLCLGSDLARAQTSYPTRPITIVVPFAAGATADLLTRMTAEKLRGILGQTVIVENRTGGGGNIGTEYVAKAPPDGYVLLSGAQLTFSINHLLNPKLAFDPRALEPVSILAQYPTLVVGRANLPVNTVTELIAYARANPGKVNFASQGIGQIGHLTFEGLKQAANVDMVHVPYRGSAPALNDLLGGQVDVIADTPLATLPHIRAGKMKLLAVGSTKRLAEFPAVESLAEVVPGFESETWMGVAAPPGTPKEIIRSVSDAIAKALQMPDVKTRISELAAEPRGTTPEEMASLIRQSLERWGPVVTGAKITTE
jgi:tripartite-type tricarboxylate transporter receptor subunit TctC